VVFNKRLIGRIYRRHSTLVRALNENALFIAWAKENKGCRVFSELSNTGAPHGFYRYVNQLAAPDGRPIDYLEFGVAEGRSLRVWSGLNGHPESRFYGFDSFYGLPEDWRWALGGMPRGSFSTNGQAPGIDDARVTCIKGLFQDSLPSFLRQFRPRNPLIVHLDCDLYSSTLYCLTQLDPILQQASVIFDQFDNLLHEFAALTSYADSYRRRYRVLARLGYFKKVALQVTGRY
jgi:O-methyltransferase